MGEDLEQLGEYDLRRRIAICRGQIIEHLEGLCDGSLSELPDVCYANIAGDRLASALDALGKMKEYLGALRESKR